jgi:hypothetical protein
VSEYLKRLRNHPGLLAATMMTALGALAGSGNESFEPLHGAIFGACVMGVFVWPIVLWTARK